jgi:hypothetical protein
LIVGALACSALMAESANAQAPPTTIITFPWDWHISVLPNIGSPTAPQPGEIPIPIWLWGTATMAFGQPVNVGDPMAPPTFDLGPGGVGSGTPTLQPPPIGGTYEIPIELVSMELHSMMPVEFPSSPNPTSVIIRESPSRPSVGAIKNLQNNGDGTIQLDSFFDVFTEIELTDLGMLLHNEQPMGAGMSFGTSNPDPPSNMVAPPLPETDVLWAPTWVWNTYPPGQAPQWVDASFHPWDWWVTIHGHVTVPEPATFSLMSVAAIGMGLASLRRRRAA